MANETLGEALPREMARVRDLLLLKCDSIPTGACVAGEMRRHLEAAAKAMAEGEMVEMLRSYQILNGFEV